MRLFGCATQATTDVNPVCTSGNPTPQLGNFVHVASHPFKLGRFNWYFLIILIYNVVYHPTSAMGYVENCKNDTLLDIRRNMPYFY